MLLITKVIKLYTQNISWELNSQLINPGNYYLNLSLYAKYLFLQPEREYCLHLLHGHRTAALNSQG